MATPEDLAWLAAHPFLSVGDRRAVLTLLSGPRISPRHPLTHSIQGIKLQRGVSLGPRRIYRVFGSGDVDAPAEASPDAAAALRRARCFLPA
jgi:hypothetical protein